MLIFMGEMGAISPDIYEAAMVDGAGVLRRMVSITIPGIMPVITIMLILSMER